jgi:AraC-like DNA-binding protein
MAKLFFSESTVKVIADIQSWRVVSSIFQPELPTVASPMHSDWMMENADIHAHAEVLMVLDGECLFGAFGNVYKASPGSIFVFNPFDAHDREYPTWTSQVTHLWLSFFEDTVFAQTLTCTAGKISDIKLLILPSSPGAHWQEIFHRLIRNTEIPAEIKRLKVYSALGDILFSILKAETLQSDERQGSIQRQVIDAMKLHIQRTCGKGVNLDVLSRISGYSKFHLERLFKQYTGLSIHNYINACRIQRTRELLESGSSKKEIAAVLGFSCLSAFSRWLKQSGLNSPANSEQ